MKGIERLRGTYHHRIVFGKQHVSGIADKRRIHSCKPKPYGRQYVQKNIVQSRYTLSATQTTLDNTWIKQALCKSYLVYPTYQSTIAIQHIHTSKTLFTQNFSSHKTPTSKDIEHAKLGTKYCVQLLIFTRRTTRTDTNQFES